MIDRKEARKRNLLVKLFKVYDEDTSISQKNFNKEDLKQKFYFKESDIINSINKILKEKNGVFNICEETAKELQEFKKNKDESIKEFEKNQSIKEEYKKIYMELKDYFSNSVNEKSIYINNMKRAIEIAKILHWIYMPIYSEQMIENRGIIPEKNLEEYYNHFHSIEDLYYELIDMGKPWKTIDGDINLNKEMNFKIYTSRWGNSDNYKIKRTATGWYVDFIRIKGHSEKSGKGSLEDNLRQDSVVYPKEGVEYALETLWNEADETEMNIDELQYKLQQIADWISAVEKAAHEYQPDWCGYY